RKPSTSGPASATTPEHSSPGYGEAPAEHVRGRAFAVYAAFAVLPCGAPYGRRAARRRATGRDLVAAFRSSGVLGRSRRGDPAQRAPGSLAACRGAETPPWPPPVSGVSLLSGTR
ncbi:hypothetical protein ACWDTT_38115, partial [Streptosporangium sandarakinum]